MTELRGGVGSSFRTGDENGYRWVFQQDGVRGFDGMHYLEPGDYLIIYGEDDKLVFDGVIVPDNTRAPVYQFWVS